MKACGAFPRVGEHWTWSGRKALQKHWAENVKRGRKVLSIRAFATFYKFSHGRLQRELKAGYTGLLMRDQARGGWMYPEYSALLAQRRAEEAKAAKGRRSVVTNRFAERLVAFLAQGLSVATCLHALRCEGWVRLPSQRTVYQYLKDGVIVLPKGRLRHRPRKTRPRNLLRRGKPCPDHRSIEERPPKVLSRQRFGDWGMDRVVSGRGGLLALLERRTRHVLLRPLRTINQRAVHRASAASPPKAPRAQSTPWPPTATLQSRRRKAMVANSPTRPPSNDASTYPSAPPTPTSLGRKHANGLLRFWSPKGTDFAKASPSEIARVQAHLNAISHPHSLNGRIAHEAFLGFS